jgi:hypothetical protein
VVRSSAASDVYKRQPVVHESGFEGGLEGRGVHPSHHENAVGLGVLNNGGDESVGVVFQWQLHGAERRKV